MVMISFAFHVASYYQIYIAEEDGNLDRPISTDTKSPNKKILL
jgi:hypothetical protein